MPRLRMRYWGGAGGVSGVFCENWNRGRQTHHRLLANQPRPNLALRIRAHTRRRNRIYRLAVINPRDVAIIPIVGVRPILKSIGSVSCVVGSLGPGVSGVVVRRAVDERERGERLLEVVALERVEVRDGGVVERRRGRGGVVGLEGVEGGDLQTYE